MRIIQGKKAEAEEAYAAVHADPAP